MPIINLMTSVLAKLTSLPIRSYQLFYPIAYMATIFVLSSIPGLPEEPKDLTAVLMLWLPPGIQNALHVPLYAGLAFLWCRSLRLWPIPAWALGALAVLLTTSYGFFDEWHQSLVPGRYSSATDAIANAAGAVVGTWLFFLGLRKLRH